MFLSKLMRTDVAGQDFIEKEEKWPRACLIRNKVSPVQGFTFQPEDSEKKLPIYDISESGLRFSPAGFMTQLSRIHSVRTSGVQKDSRLKGVIYLDDELKGAVQGQLLFLDSEVAGLSLNRVDSQYRLALTQEDREVLIVRSWQELTENYWHGAFDTNLWVQWSPEKTLQAFEFEMDSLLYRWGRFERESSYRTPNFGKSYLISAADLARAPRVSLPNGFRDRMLKICSQVKIPSEVFHQLKALIRDPSLREPVL